MNSDFQMPEGLSDKGQAAWKAIVTLLMSEDPTMETGGCKAFYSAEEWRARGERYGRDGVLVIVYDGGDHRPYFTMDSECYDLVDRMQQIVGALGCHIEECTTWYAAVYFDGKTA